MRLSILIVFLFVLQAQATNYTFYVATNGNNSWTGTLPSPNGGLTDGPFLTLATARNAVRALSPGVAGNTFTVLLRKGNYLSDTKVAFASTDSGTVASPVIYTNYPGEFPKLVGGRFITAWSAVTDPTILARLTPAAQVAVQKADLSAFPSLLPVSRYGYPSTGGWTGVNELFFNTAAMQVARYPNTGWLQTGTASAPATWVCTDPRPYTWAASTEILGSGYWAKNYAQTAELITNFNSGAQTVTLKLSNTTLSVPVANQRYYFVNVLEELDQAGEYYIDRTAKIIYFWPPSSLASGESMFTTADHIIELVNVTNVNFCGITFDGSTGHTINTGGINNVNFKHCIIRNTSARAVMLNVSQNSGLNYCEIYNTGQMGVELFGGNRTTLAAGGLYVSNSIIHDFSRLDRTYEPAVQSEQCGNYISHNRIYSAPNHAIQLYGNNQLLEYNDIFNCAYEGADIGVVYDGQDWTMTGHIIQYNYIHDHAMTNGPILGISPTNANLTIGIYLDDCKSGITIQGNCVANINTAIELGGGRNNVITNNLFPNCWSWDMNADQRLTGFGASQLQTLTNQLIAQPYQTPPWSTQYPWLTNILNDNPTFAIHNYISNNLAVVQGPSNWVGYFDSGSLTNIIPVATYISTNTSGTLLPDPLFISWPTENYRLHAYSPAYTALQGYSPYFISIPFDQVGPIPEAGPSALSNFYFSAGHYP